MLASVLMSAGLAPQCCLVFEPCVERRPQTLAVREGTGGGVSRLPFCWTMLPLVHAGRKSDMMMILVGPDVGHLVKQYVNHSFHPNYSKGSVFTNTLGISSCALHPRYAGVGAILTTSNFSLAFVTCP